MRKNEPRLYGFGVPLAAMVAGLCGAESGAFLLLSCYCAVMIGSLGAPHAFSRAASRLMSTRKVMGSLIISLLMIVPITVAVAHVASVGIAVAGALLVAARCFEELFASQGDGSSATITSVLTAIIMAACLILTRDAVDPDLDAITLTMQRGWPIAAGIVFAISGAIALGFSRKERPQPSAAIFKEIPAAVVRTAAYPAAFIALAWFSDPKFEGGALAEGFFAGLILLEMAKSTFKRGKFESAGLKIGISVAVMLVSLATVAIGCLWWSAELPLAAAIFLLAGAAAMLLYGPWDWESLAATAVMVAGAVLSAIGITPASASFPMEISIGPAVGLILCLLMLRQWAQLCRQARARRIRRKAQGRR